mgnify:FL=1
MSISGPVTFLWFDDRAEEAADFYAATFPRSERLGTTRYGEHPHKPAGSVMTAEVDIMGSRFVCLNGGPEFTHSPAVSFQIFCDTQDEIDELWSAITSDGGEEGRCGWCTDRFGVSWQVVPSNLGDLLGGCANPEAAMACMLTMSKFDIDALREAGSH